MRAKILPALTILCVGLLAGYYFFPAIRVPAEIVFDEVETNSKLHFAFSIKNSTYSAVQITGFQTGCPCNMLQIKSSSGVLTSLQGAVIPARSSLTVHASFSIIPAVGKSDYAQPVALKTDHPDHRQLSTIVKVKNIRGKLEVRPAAVQNLPAHLDQVTSLELKMFNGSIVTQKIKHVECTGSVSMLLEQPSLPIEIEPNQFRDFRVLLTPRQAGLIEGKVVVYSNDGVLELPYSLRAKGKSQLSESILMFPVNQGELEFATTLKVTAKEQIESVFLENYQDERVAFHWKRITEMTHEAVVQLSDSAKQLPFSVEVTIVVKLKNSMEKHKLRIRNIPIQ